MLYCWLESFKTLTFTAQKDWLHYNLLTLANQEKWHYKTFCCCCFIYNYFLSKNYFRDFKIFLWYVSDILLDLLNFDVICFVFRDVSRIPITSDMQLTLALVKGFKPLTNVTRTVFSDGGSYICLWLFFIRYSCCLNMALVIIWIFNRISQENEHIMYERSNKAWPSLSLKLGNATKSCITLSFLWIFVKASIKYFILHI